MLTLYRRHIRSCEHFGRKDARRFKKCGCPIWVQGSLSGEYVKKSLDLTSWTAAAEKVRGWEASGLIGEVKAQKVPTVKDAVEAYLLDLEARKVAHGTLRAYKVFLNSRFLPWCDSHGVRLLKSFGVREAREFRESWKDDSPLYAVRNLERLRAFLRFCQSEKWIPDNPAKEVKMPQAEPRRRLPFTQEEVDKLLAACDKFQGDRDRIRAFILVMFWTGFRLSDAVSLRRDAVKNGRIFIRTVKTGTDVWVPVPPVVTEALAKVSKGGPYYFWSGESKLQSRCGDYWRALQSIFSKARVRGAQSHRFRHSFITRLLDKRFSVEEVGLLAGVSPKVLLKHYYHHLKERQDYIEKRVAETF